MDYRDNRTLTEVAESMRENSKTSKDTIRIDDALWFEEHRISLPLLSRNWLETPSTAKEETA